MNRLREQDRFAHLEAEEQNQFHQKWQEKRLEVLCLTDYKRGIHHLNGLNNVTKLLAILSHPTHIPAVNPRLLHHWRSLQETFEVRFHRAEFAEAQEKFEYARAGKHLVKMEEIARRQQQQRQGRRSEEQKLSSAVLGPESMAQCRAEFDMQGTIMARFGEEMGRAIILRARERREQKGQG